jgi:hypothetical protein
MDIYLNPIELIMAERVAASFYETSYSAQKSILILQHEFHEALKINRSRDDTFNNPHRQAQVSAKKVYNVLTYGDPNPRWWKKIITNWF